MNAPNATQCPTQSALTDFGLGKLDAASAETISQHLETCADCRQRVAGVSGDTFVGRLRQAGSPPAADQRQRTYVPGESLANAANSTDGMESRRAGIPTPSRSKDRLSPASGSRRAPGGSPPDPSSVSAPPELANHPDYELIKELGQGGMGTVYLAKNRMMDRMEVLKVISKTLLDRPGALERFQQEIRSAAKLSHPNIVAAYSVLRPGELLVFAMEYVKGQDLSQVVKQRGPLPVANAAFYIHQVANGLQHAFEKGMVHRDIKPNNLMLAIEGKKHVVKILDFGLAKSLAATTNSPPAESSSGAASGKTSASDSSDTAKVAGPISKTSSPADGPTEAADDTKLTAKEAFSLRQHTAAATRVAFHRSKPLLVSGGEDGQVLLWNLADRAAQTTLYKFPQTQIWAIKFSPDGRAVAHTNRYRNGSKVYFKTLSGQVLKAVSDFKTVGAVASIAYSPDGRLFAAGQDDGSIRLWDLAQFKEIAPVSLGVGQNIRRLAFGQVTVGRKNTTEYLLAAAGKEGMVRTLTATLSVAQGVGCTLGCGIKHLRCYEFFVSLCLGGFYFRFLRDDR